MRPWFQRLADKIRIRVSFGKRGTTLVELIIAMGVSAMLLTAVYAVLYYGLHYYRDSTAEMEVERNALLAVMRLSNEMAEGSRMSLAVFDSNDKYPGVIFGSPRDESGQVAYIDGVIQWQKFVAYYKAVRNGRFVLVRKEMLLPKPVSEPPVVPVDLTPEVFEGRTDLPERIMARGIERFELVDTKPIQLTVEAVDNRADFSLELQTSLLMRN